MNQNIHPATSSVDEGLARGSEVTEHLLESFTSLYRLCQPTVPQGRSGAQVQETLRENGEHYVVKENHDPRIAEIEVHLYKGLHQRRFPVPVGVEREGSKVLVPYVEGMPLDVALINSYAAALCGNKQLAEFCDAHIDQAWDLVVELDSLVNEILTDKQKEFLAQRRISATANRFSIPEEEAKANYYAYRVAEAFNITDYENVCQFVEEFSPLQKKLTEMLECYGNWNAGCSYPKNIILTPEGRLVFIDFNNPNFSGLQESDSFLLDAYLPLKAPNGQNYKDSIISMAKKPGLLLKKIDLWNRKNPDRKITNDKNYLEGFLLFGAVRNIRQLSYGFKEVQALAADSEQDKQLFPLDVYDTSRAVLHHFEMARVYFATLETKYSYAPIAQRLEDHFNTVIKPVVEPFYLRAEAQLENEC